MLTRKEQAAISKAKIINVTRNLIKEKGYDDIHISEITSKCGMTVGNFYNYFKSKEQLFVEIDAVEFYDSFLSLKEELNIPVLKRLSSYIREWFHVTLEHYGANYMYHWTQRYSKVSFGKESNDKVDFVANHVAHILKMGIAKKELREDTPVECISYSVAFAIFGCSAHFGVNGDEQLVRNWVNQYCEIFINGVLAQYLN